MDIVFPLVPTHTRDCVVLRSFPDPRLAPAHPSFWASIGKRFERDIRLKKKHRKRSREQDERSDQVCEQKRMRHKESDRAGQSYREGTTASSRASPSPSISSVDSDATYRTSSTGITIASDSSADNTGSLDTTPTTLQARKAKLVDGLMANVMRFLDKSFNTADQPCEAGDNDDGPTGNSGKMTGGSRGPSGSGRTRKVAEKRGHVSDDGNSSQEEEGARKGRQSKKARQDQDSNMFACPYLKNSPGSPVKANSCRSRFPEIHRVKYVPEHSPVLEGHVANNVPRGHLQRVHGEPKNRCPRCSTTFAESSDLTAHFRLAEACEVRDVDRTFELDSDKFEKIIEVTGIKVDRSVM